MVVTGRMQLIARVSTQIVNRTMSSYSPDEVSEKATQTHTTNGICHLYMIRKMVPIIYKVSELIPCIFCMYVKRRRGRENNRTINLPKVIKFFTEYKYST